MFPDREITDKLESAVKEFTEISSLASISRLPPATSEEVDSKPPAVWTLILPTAVTVCAVITSASARTETLPVAAELTTPSRVKADLLINSMSPWSVLVKETLFILFSELSSDIPSLVVITTDAASMVLEFSDCETETAFTEI